VTAKIFQQVDIVYTLRFEPFGLGGLSGEDGEHKVTDKESSPSFDIKCPPTGNGAINISFVFATSALILTNLL